MVTWIKKPLALSIHDRQLGEHGGGPGVRDDGLLDSALVRPKQAYAYGKPAPDLAALAASLAFGLARSHPFIDGNKRTAAVACETFILLNGGVLLADDLELYPVYLTLAEGSLSEVDFASWLRERIRVETTDAVHEPRARYRR